MSPKNPNVDPANQGSFFNEEIVHSGSTDADQQRTEIHLSVNPDGSYPEPPDSDRTVYEGELSEIVHEAIKSDHRRAGQLGKHSAVEATGRYSDGVQPGKVLPGFGIVTYANIEAARQFARDLDDKRS